jgi:hypothetical protein
MGGKGSGNPHKYDLSKESTKSLIKGIYVYCGGEWKTVAKKMGITEETLAKYRKHWPGFDLDCSEALAAEAPSFFLKLRKGCFNDKGEVINTVIATKIAERLGIFERESKSPLAAFQLNNGGEAGQSLNVVFMDAPALPQATYPSVLDAQTD